MILNLNIPKERKRRMKLKLHNFKCYTEKEFEFVENTTTLIHGASGGGKTTILDAIYFALTGVGNKVITSGKTSCKVVLETQGLVITRSKRPNKLLVGSLEGVEAQAAIDKKFGKDIYYLQQDVRNSFILMTPLEKLSFLEKLVFNDIDISSLKQDAKGIIKECETGFVEAQAKVGFVKKLLDTASGANVPSKTMDEIQSLLESGKKQHVENVGEMSFLRSRLNECANMKGMLASKRSSLAELENELEQTSKFLLINLTLKQINAKLDELKKKNEILRQSERFKTLKKEIDNEKEYLQKEIDRAKKKVIDEYQQSVVNPDLIDNLKDQRRQMEIYFQIQRERDSVLTCPVCFTNLKVNNDHLVKADHSRLDPRVEEIEKKYTIKAVEMIDKEIFRAQRQIERYKELEKQINNDVYVPDLVKKTKMIISQYTSELDTISQYLLSHTPTPVETKKEIDVEIGDMQSLQNKVAGQMIVKSQLEDRLRQCKIAIDGIEKKMALGGEFDEDLIKTKLEKLEKVCENWACVQIALEKEKEEVNKYQKYLELKKDMETALLCEKEAENRYNASLLYRSKILEAESMAMESVIDAFNSHLKTYLDQFFDEPITVMLTLSPDDKKVNKYQLQLCISYKGMDCDIGTLSGGEGNRVVVASTLAMCEIVNSPLIMLDESVNNLDATTAANVIQVLNNMTERTVLLISHQAVTGIFASTVEIK